MLTEKILVIGIILIIIGIFLTIIASILLSFKTTDKSKIEVGVGGIVGIFPFGFFTSKRAFWLWAALAALTIVIWLFARKLL